MPSLARCRSADYIGRQQYRIVVNLDAEHRAKRQLESDRRP